MGVLTTLAAADQREVFIETGYGWGLTLGHMVQLPCWRRLYSIEYDKAIAAKGAAAWAGTLGRVQVIQGDSAAVLPGLIVPTVPTTFWLDAHWSGGRYYGEARPPVECPLLAELAAITGAGWQAPHTVLVDDVRLFQRGKDFAGLREAEWPTWGAVVAVLEGAGYAMGYAGGDILWARL